MYFLETIEQEDSLSTSPGHSEVIKHMVYGEGETTKSTYESTINVAPNLDYDVRIEVLRNDLGENDERVSKITFDGVTIGDCNPDGSDYDCTFFDCRDTIQNAQVSSETGSIRVALTYQGHSWDCDCDKETWDCSPENQVSSRTPMTAAARITLIPISGNYSSSCSNILFSKSL